MKILGPSSQPFFQADRSNWTGRPVARAASGMDTVRFGNVRFGNVERDQVTRKTRLAAVESLLRELGLEAPKVELLMGQITAQLSPIEIPVKKSNIPQVLKALDLLPDQIVAVTEVIQPGKPPNIVQAAQLSNGEYVFLTQELEPAADCEPYADYRLFMGPLLALKEQPIADKGFGRYGMAGDVIDTASGFKVYFPSDRKREGSGSSFGPRAQQDMGWARQLLGGAFGLDALSERVDLTRKVLVKTPEGKLLEEQKAVTARMVEGA